MFDVNMNRSVRQLECPHQASLEERWFKVAANLNYDPWTVYIQQYMRTKVWENQIAFIVMLWYTFINVFLGGVLSF